MWKTNSSVTPANSSESYLREHLLRLEESFALLSAQFKTQLESKDRQIDGLQRTVDALLGAPREKSFRKPATETGRVVEMYPAEQSEKKKSA